MSSPHAIQAVAASLLALLVAGCESLPERYSAEKLASVGRELSTADSLYAELGPPSLERENGRLAIHTWQDSVPYPSRSMLVLEFDTDGRLLNSELSRAVKPAQSGLERYSQSARYCTAGGTCIEHGIYGNDGIQFDNAFSAVIVKGAAKARIRPTEPRADECTLVIWPGEGWSESHSTRQTPNGVALSVDGASKWSFFRWVPTGAFARIVLPAGDHVVTVRDPVWDERMSNQDTLPDDRSPTWWEVVGEIILATPPEEYDLPASSAPFHCWAGERVFLTVDAAFVERAGEHWFPILLHSKEPAEAEALMSEMAQVLPPDP